MKRTLTRDQLKVRMLRGLSGLSQEELERKAGVENIAHIEHGLRTPSADQIARICSSLNLAPADCEEMFRIYETRSVSKRSTEGFATLLEALDDLLGKPAARPDSPLTIEAILSQWESRTQGEPDSAPSVALDRANALRAWGDLCRLKSFDDMKAVIRVGKSFQTWGIVELLCHQSRRPAWAPPDPAAIVRSIHFAALATETVQYVQASPEWRRRLHGYALMHLAKARFDSGDLEGTRPVLTEARTLWDSGQDPDNRLDSTRFVELNILILAGLKHSERAKATDRKKTLPARK